MLKKGHGTYTDGLDTNNNGVIDEGDYFGRTSSKITSSGGVLTGVELRVSPNVGPAITGIWKLSEEY